MVKANQISRQSSWRTVKWDAGDGFGGNIVVLWDGPSEESLVEGGEHASVVGLQRGERGRVEFDIEGSRSSQVVEKCDMMEHLPVEICQVQFFSIAKDTWESPDQEKVE